MTWISTPRGLYGESGIRTHGTLTSTHAFQACTLGHSVISPAPWMEQGRLRTGMYRQTPQRHGWSKGGCPSTTMVHQNRKRREWDSNPRSRKRLNGFRDRPIRPLSHLSETHDGSRSAKYKDVPEPTERHEGASAAAYKEVRADAQPTQDGALGSKTTRGRPPASSRGRRPSSSCPRGFEPPTFRSAV